ncbi:helix-turn-helix domain-containing protein [Rubripirellula reticaptiva]|uniref:DNA-binding transcriptional repressor PuuR n=1 Tax=Rubripirellula reticaptiva TaxID=2528013 RepID=A0A5C6F289_9BACT|nr:helix-turn-helix transcriptional regulator [Rubripirellula reticaptiva]TWU55933.1 DNA-binding transcriptional repressor PuuR [Rubripirellula reticaptiva]
MDQIELEFGKVVRKYREKAGHSQEGFADVAGLHRTYISSIELGKVQVGIGVAEKLAIALDVPLSKLFREIERRRDNQSG